VAAGEEVSDADVWLARHTAEAPPVLRERVMHYAKGSAPGALPRHLADAGVRALAAVEGHPGDRSAALDLLAADALVTLALLAQAQQDPAGLRRFAGDMLRRAVNGS
jgi:hypothetical protein